MVKVTNMFGDEYSGKVGNAGVFAKWKGRQYRRKYVVPSNPNTVQQQTVRGSFTNAVDLWHDFLSLQRSAYGYMATGLTMSGFNLLVSRWQKMTPGERAAYVEPYMGMIQVGSTDPTAITQISTVGSQAEYTTEEVPLVLGTTVYTPATSGVDLYATVEINRGRVNVTKTLSGGKHLKIDYTAQGRTITGEDLATDPQSGDVLYTLYWPIDYKSVELYEDTTAKDGLEVDIVNGKFYFTKTAPGDTSGDIDADKYTAIENAKLETRKVDTNFITWRGYTDEDGILLSSQTSEDGTRDVALSASSYQSKITANVSAEDACEDQYVKLTAA